MGAKVLPVRRRGGGVDALGLGGGSGGVDALGQGTWRRRRRRLGSTTAELGRLMRQVCTEEGYTQAGEKKNSF